MRLTIEEIRVLKDSLARLSPQAELYLFGSRVDDQKRGGDIDLLVVSDQLTKKEIRKLRLDFFSHFGEQKMDILLDNGQFTEPFHQMVKQKAVLL